MDKKIAFIGAGNVSTALGLYFKDKSFVVRGYFSRSPASAEKAAQLTHSTAYASVEKLMQDSQMIWITTPDDQIAAVAYQLSQLSVPQCAEKLVLHASGAHSVDILKPLKEKGYQTAAAHPLFSFNDPVSAQKKLSEVWFAVEQLHDENEQISNFFKRCGNHVLHVDAKKKTLYHAAACMLANYLVTLADASYKIFKQSGVEKNDIKKATMPLLESVIQTCKTKEPKEALTGPIKRGDQNTIKLHMQALHLFAPEMADLYKFMGKQTMHMLGDYSLKKLFD